MSDLTIIIPVKNDARRLANCLESIARNDSAPPTVIVVDNGSSDNSQAIATQAGARVLVLPDLRVSELRNAGAAVASSEFIGFVDADHELSATWVSAAADAFGAASVGATGALYTAPESGTWVQRMYGLLRGRTVGRHEVPWLGSGNLILRKRAFDAVGGFDVALEACEDVDLCQRLRAAGWIIVGDERLKSVHLGDPPTLAALFRAERWRGRDNIRVSLRAPLSLRDLPSVLSPVVTLAALALTAAAPVAAWRGVSLWWPAGLALALVVAFAVVKAIRMVARASAPEAFLLPQALIVVLTYDLARAIALIGSAPHHRAHRPAPPVQPSR